LPENDLPTFGGEGGNGNRWGILPKLKDRKKRLQKSRSHRGVRIVNSSFPGGGGWYSSWRTEKKGGKELWDP